MTAGKLFLVVADTTDLVTDLRVESLLLEGLVRAGSRPPVGGLFYRSLGGILHNRFTKRSTMLSLNVSQLFAPVHVRLRRDDAIRGVGAPHIKVSILEAALAVIEHIKRLRLVLFHRGHCSLKHRSGFFCGAKLRCQKGTNGKKNQNHDATGHECETADHRFLLCHYIQSPYRLTTTKGTQHVGTGYFHYCNKWPSC